jgi:phage terminase large subunit
MGVGSKPELWLGALEYYRRRRVEFINDWVMTYGPRLAGTDMAQLMPFRLCRRERELVEFIYSYLNAHQSGLIEKSRDMGATWACAAVSVHLWLFWPGASIGWGSRKAMLVDHLDNRHRQSAASIALREVSPAGAYLVDARRQSKDRRDDRWRGGR